MNVLKRPLCWIRGHDYRPTIIAYINGDPPDLCWRCGYKIKTIKVITPPPIDLAEPVKFMAERVEHSPDKETK